MRGALWLWPWLLVGFAPPFGPDQGAEEDARLAAGEAVRLLVSYDHPPGPSEVARVEALGGRVTHRWTGVVHALAADLTRSQAEALAAADPGVVFIEPSRPTSATVAYAARQTGQRGAVDPEPNRDFTGAGQVVAVVDAGFDASHVDFEGRLRAWADFVGASVDRGGDLYPRATDAQGHGTAVGGMMAGRGLGAPAGAVPISFHAGFHPQAGWCRDAPLPLSPRAGGRVVVRLQPALGAARYTLSHRHYVDGGRSPGAANVEVGAFAGQGAARFELDVAARSGYGDYLCPFPADAATQGSPLQMQALVPWVEPDGRARMAGMAPDAELVALKVGDDQGAGNSCTHIDAYEWLFQRARAEGIGVVNISRTVNGGRTVLTEDAAVNHLVRTHGILFVTTPGNGWTAQPAVGRVGSPGSAKEAITVGAITPYDERAAYSQPGSPAQSVPKPDLVAPGGTFRTPLLLPDANTAACSQPPCAPEADPFPDDYRGWDGTSFAAPLVAGVLAQLLEADGGVRHEYDQVLRLRALLTMTATPVGVAAPGTPVDGQRRPISYFEGAGRLNADAALDAAQRWWRAGDVVRARVGAGAARAVARRVHLRAGEPVVVRAHGDATFELHLFDAAVEETPTAPNLRVMACGGDDPADPGPQAAAGLPTRLALARLPAPAEGCACDCGDAAPATRCLGPGADAAAACPAACAAAGRPWTGAHACGDDEGCGAGGCACACGPPTPTPTCADALADDADAAARCPAACAALGLGYAGAWRCEDGGCGGEAALFYQPAEDGEAVVVLKHLGGEGGVDLHLGDEFPLCDPLVERVLVGAPCTTGVGACAAEGRLVCQAGQRARCQAPVPPGCEPPPADAGVPDAGVADAAVLDAAVEDAALEDATLPDAAVEDAALPDAALPDAARPDAALPDAARPDAALPDAARPDAAVPDAARPDAARPDAAVEDAARPDAARPDAATTPPRADDDGCRATPGRSGELLPLLALLALAARRRWLTRR